MYLDQSRLAATTVMWLSLWLRGTLLATATARAGSVLRRLVRAARLPLARQLGRTAGGLASRYTMLD
jgi:hypothetical protein